jgi:hypothetical protein
MKVELGVVEDRKDPEQMGRVRVRIIGRHSSDLNEIPTESLPWATVMLPTTSPSVSGLGHTQFLVEGSWVVVAFNDEYMQDPIVLGSIGSMPSVLGGDHDPTRGFGDLRENVNPEEKYPRYVDEPDYNRLGRGLYASKHWSLKKRLSSATKFNEGGDEGGSPIASKPNMEATGASASQDRTFWKEPVPGPTGGFSQYPYNHVFESEAGHVIEVDDSPKAPRLMTQHTSGTFEEIHPDGKKVTKIVKDSYEIILGDNSIFINGDCNMTINGNMRTLIKKDYILEVGGSYYEKIGRNKAQKIGGSGRGNHSVEISGHLNKIITKADLRVSNSFTGRILTSSSLTTGTNYSVSTILGNLSLYSNLNVTIEAILSTAIKSVVTTAVKSLGKTYINAGALVDIRTETGLINMYASTSISGYAVGNLSMGAGGMLSTTSVLASTHTAGTIMNVSSVGVNNISANGILNLSSNVVIRGDAPVIMLN